MPEWLMEIPAGFWDVLGKMSPYLLFGFFVAGALSVLISPRLIERHLGGRGLWPVLKAAAFGVPLPLCSCGVIPVSASLRRHGASKGATTAFLISTPQTGVDSIFVTFSLLGPVYAIFRPLVALVGGVLGGGLVNIIDPDKPGTAPHPEDCEDECCASGRSNWLVRMLRYGFVVLPRDIGKTLVAGLVIAALLSALIPENFFHDRLGGIMSGHIVGMLIMMGLGIPVYVCATASVPVAAVLIAAGVSPGTALVFLMTGPATNAAALATIWKIMGRRTALCYLATVAAMALGSGLLLDHIFRAGQIEAAPAGVTMMSPWIRGASAVALLGVIGFALLAPKRVAHDDLSEIDGDAGDTGDDECPQGDDKHGHTHSHTGEPGHRISLAITGMTCTHCANSIHRALMETAGVRSAEVDLSAKRADIVGSGVDVAACIWAIEQLGYSASQMNAARDDPGGEQ